LRCRARRASRAHVERSIAASIDRARAVLGYRPRCTSLDAMRESLRHLIATGQVDVDGQIL
jgi:nucleoside-diphosphate-sugar epimerase